MVQTRLLRILFGLALLWTTACSGTPADENGPETPQQPEATPSSTTNPETGNPEAADPGAVTSDSGQDGTQEPSRTVGEQREQFLVRESLAEARRSLDLRLWSDAARIAAEVLEMEPGNSQAREILLDANAAMGSASDSVERQFLDRVRQGQIANQKMVSDVRRELGLGDALMGEGKYGDAIVHFQRSQLLLRYSPYLQPGSELQREVEMKLEAAKQAKVTAQRADEESKLAASRAELEASERRLRIQRSTRVKRLLEQANFDFQIGAYEESVQLLDQALGLEPNNANALSLRQLADRARHENRMDVLRNDWSAEWSRTFDDLNTLDVPQTESVEYNVEYWRNEVSKREPLSFSHAEDVDSPEERAIVQRLKSTKIEHRFSSAPIDDWAKYYAQVTDVTFVVSPAVRDLDADTTTLADFQLPPMSVYRALEVIGSVTGVRWKVEHGVVQLVTPEQAGGKLYLVQYGVHDIVTGVANRPGPDLKLRSPADEDVFGFEEDDVPAPTVVDAGRLTDLIRANIAPESWDVEGGGTIGEQRGVLLVRHNRKVHEQIERLLADMRTAVGIQVDIESRFLEVDDQFLEDIGVDFRGLGNQAASGVPGRGLEGPGNNVSFDDFGTRNVINPATPGEIGTGTEPGFFYNDGGDGDILARTENLFDQTLGGEDTITNAGGLSLQYVFLDDAELEVILRAVAKQQRSELITAPRLLVYNNTRASMNVLRQTSYIRDFDVEIAQAAAVANPIVDIVRDGVVLDVRPVVSADRRFITMELRPTIMNLQLPIPTFTTTLGVGQPVSIQLPRTTLQRVRTTITMPDGGTLMLGGMKLAQKQRLVSQVPILGEIPIIGFFFSRKGTFTQNRKILILVRATIVIPDEHAPDLDADELAGAISSGR